MRILSRVPISLLVPVVALIALAFSRGSPEPPAPAESSEMTWRPLHDHGGEARGPNGLGIVFRAVNRQGPLIYAMAPRQSFRSKDGGATWTELPRAQHGWDAALSPDGIVLIGGRGKVVRSTDGGESWTEITTAADGLVAAIALDGRHAIGVGQDVVLRSTDAGASWKRVPAPAVNYFDVAIRGRAIVAVGGAGLVVRSGDGGETWQHEWLPTEALLIAVAFAADRVVVIATGDGTLLRSTDAGASWATVDSRSPAPLRGIAFADERHGLAVGFWGEAMRTTDAGATWQRELSGTRLHLDDVEADPDGGFLVSGSRETVFSVTPGGAR